LSRKTIILRSLRNYIKNEETRIHFYQWINFHKRIILRDIIVGMNIVKVMFAFSHVSNEIALYIIEKSLSNFKRMTDGSLVWKHPLGSGRRSEAQ